MRNVLGSARVILVLQVCLLAACGGGGDTSPTGVQSLPSAGLRFDFTGGGNGSYTAPAADVVLTGATAQTSTWAAAATGAGAGVPNGLLVVGNVAHGDGTADEVVLTINSRAVGTTTVTAGCTASTSSSPCSGLVFAIGLQSGGTGGNYVCLLASGTITVASIASNSVAGTFSGSGSCQNASLITSPFTVSGGEFNLRLIATE